METARDVFVLAKFQTCEVLELIKLRFHATGDKIHDH
jgi:hypothetical protein